MTQTQVYDPIKQESLDQLEILNARAYHFYIKNKGKFTDYGLKSQLWSSDIWNEAKCIFKELNEHLYGHLTCEICFTGFYSNKLSSFQLHHEQLEYNWEKLFNPEDTHVVHKSCHKKKLELGPGDQK